MISLSQGPTTKVAIIPGLSTVEFLNHLAMASLHYRMVAALAGIGAKIVTPEDACQASDSRVRLGINCCPCCQGRKDSVFRAS